MAFLPLLEEVVRSVDGALACSVMGFDGIAVESFQLDAAADLDVQSTLIEYAAVLQQVALRHRPPDGGTRFAGRTRDRAEIDIGRQVGRARRLERIVPSMAAHGLQAWLAGRPRIAVIDDQRGTPAFGHALADVGGERDGGRRHFDDAAGRQRMHAMLNHFEEVGTC